MVSPGAVVATVVITAIYQTFTPGTLRIRQALGGALLTAVLTGAFSLLLGGFETVLELEGGHEGDEELV